MKLFDIGTDNLAARFIRLVDNTPDFFIDQFRGRFRDILRLGNRMAEEDFFLIIVVAKRTQFVAHAPFGYHLPRQICRLHDVIGRTRGDFVMAENNLFRHTSTHSNNQIRLDLIASERQVILFRKAHNHTKRTSAWNNRRLMDRIRSRRMDGRQGVPRFVVSGELLLVLAHHHGTPLRAHHDLILRVFHFLHGNDPVVLTGRQQSRFVYQVRQVSAGKARRPTGDDLRINIRCGRHLAQMHLQDEFAPPNIGVRHDDLAVEPAGTQERRIEDVRTIRRGDEDHALVRLKTIHLDQQLIQCLLALIIAATKSGAAVPPNCIHFIDKQQTRRILLSLLEHIAHTASADTDKHLDKLGAGDREEWHICFARNGARQERFTRPWRTDEEHSLRNAATQALELLRIAQELDDFLELLFRFVNTGDIFKCHAPRFFRQQACA